MDSHALLLLLSLIIHFSSSVSDSSLKEGSYLSVKDVLESPTGVFSAGFCPVGDNAYCFAIWFTEPSCSRDDCTIVWMANRDFPVNGIRSKLWLQKTGNLVLTDAGKYIAWSTDTVSPSSTDLILYDTGNLALQNVEGVILWQSFDSPTNTLLPSQRFTKDMQLVSSRSRTNFSSGFYKLFFNNDNLLCLLYDDSKVTSIYWPTPWLVSWATGRFPYNSSRLAFLDTLGKFTSSDNFSFVSADYGVRLQRRLTIDFDGNLRLYSRKKGNNATWVVSWQALSQPCEIHGACGPYSKCSHSPISGRRCSCLPGYRVKNANDWSSGCESKFYISCDNDTDQFRFIRLPHVEFYGHDYGVYPGYTLEMCRKLCLSLCGCKGFQHRYIGDGMWPLVALTNNIRQNVIPSLCYPKILLLNGQRSPSFDGQFYLKVPKTRLFSDKENFSGLGLNCSTELHRPLNRVYQKSSQNEKLRLTLWFAYALGAVEIIGILLVWCFLFSSEKDLNEASQGYHHPAITGFKRFTYSELKKATGNFSVEIGRGAGGTVYKGTLPDNRIAAIKRLNIANQGQAEFLTEVSTIGKLNHMNLIEMWGYCAEREHRLLVYEYMEHGSLAEKISSRALDWRKRFQIALGTARGLAYLHEECLEWVLHCDVKPQNVLLDSSYQPKVSDFGLSKLLKRSGDLSCSIFSRIRGTRGYMAPEWVFNLPITSKADVYSFGIVVLEMVTGKSPAIGGTSTNGEGEELQRGLVTWVRQNKKNGGESWIEEIVDPILEGDYDKGEMEMLVMLALQCVEEDKDARPTMSKAVEILLHRKQYL
ncbi:putative receptor protein kinase ZmPK1 [Hevea brasiliensis]|uniref:putative receptor protein kinase ZmPK1 n=1 Tax=Hevea brasiliensis TaxID=3981 RepID=UPI0025CDBF36|nr:putative receptor protein kinase ZmPK1 [Hevea brasiliensis]